MRMNGPVTNAEYVLPEGEVIITHTDTSSRITYANPAFLTSSGFNLEECLGQPQNMVRHPDMPVEAFADLWQTIRAGKSWTGIVKNRRKDGGFYWVRANVTPMMMDGRCTGYMSVRIKPTRDEITTAERVYADLRAGRARHLRINQGQIFDTSVIGAFKRAMNPSLKTGTWVLLGFLTALLAGVGVAGVATRGFDWISCLTMLGAAI